MTWGSHCPQCGREDCRWTTGDRCEGKSPRLPDGFRITAHRRDFDVPGWFYCVEHLDRGWLLSRWREVSGTRSGTPEESVALAKIALPRSALAYTVPDWLTTAVEQDRKIAAAARAFYRSPEWFHLYQCGAVSNAWPEYVAMRNAILDSEARP